MRRIAILLVLTMGIAACSSVVVDETTSTAPPISLQETTTTTTTQVDDTTTTTVPETTTTTEPLPEGVREFAYVVAVEASDDGAVVSADYAQFLTGDEAIQAAIEDGFIVEGEVVPNDYYIVNENPQLRELELDSDAPIALNACFVDGECVTQVRVTIDQWVALLDGDAPEGLGDGFQWYGQGALPYWLILDGETIIGVEEQYLP